MARMAVPRSTDEGYHAVLTDGCMAVPRSTDSGAYGGTRRGGRWCTTTTGRGCVHVMWWSARGRGEGGRRSWWERRRRSHGADTCTSLGPCMLLRPGPVAP
eukprot:3475723-Rhodomonas_salina.1